MFLKYMQNWGLCKINCHVLKIPDLILTSYVLLSSQTEATHWSRKDPPGEKGEENNKKVTNLKDELTKLKSFALLVVDEQQRLARAADPTNNEGPGTPEYGHSGSRGAELRTIPGCKKRRTKSFAWRRSYATRPAIFHQEQEAMTAKLTNEDAQNRQLRQKLSTLSRQLDELGETNKTLHRAEEELLELRDKISRGECGNSSLMTEVEELRNECSKWREGWGADQDGGDVQRPSTESWRRSRARAVA